MGAANIDDEGDSFEEKMQRLVKTLEDQFAESLRLAQVIGDNLASLLEKSA